MDMKLRSWYMVIISLVLGLAAAWIAGVWLLKKTDQVEAKNIGMDVAVATFEIPYGAKVESRSVKLIKVPRGTELGNHFANLQDVIGKVTKQKILPGEVLLKDKFTEPGVGSALAALIQPQMRAVTVRVDDVVGVAGFLLPGNHVDVIASRRDSEHVTTKTVLSNLNVLAVDQSSGTDKNEPVVVRAVTLEMTPQQAEILMRSREEGKIQLALRNPSDFIVPEETIEAVVPKVVTASERQPKVITQKAIIKKLTPIVVNASAPIEPPIVVIRGTRVESESP